jgi:hypothetical protein
VSEPQTEAGLLSLPGADPVYLDDGPGIIHAISEAIRYAERQAVLRWLDTEAEGLLAEALTEVQGGRYDSWLGRAPSIVSHLRERMTP